MTDDEALELLKATEQAAVREWVAATRVEGYRGGGGSQAWDIASGTEVYVTKFQNNPQEPATAGDRRKILPTELIVGRVGQLLQPAACPRAAVVDVDEALIIAKPVLINGVRAIAGPSVGSLAVQGAFETKDGIGLEAVSAERLAVLILFQTLMHGDDLAILIADNGSSAYSIDHGHFFGGGSWGNHTGPAAEAPQLRVHPTMAARLNHRAVWDDGLAQCEALTDDGLAGAFAAIPAEWGCDVGFLAPVLGVTSRRRNLLRRIVDAYC